MSDGEKVLSVSLGRRKCYVSIKKNEPGWLLKTNQEKKRGGGRGRVRGQISLGAHLEFIFLEIMATPPVKGIMIWRVFLVAERRHRPNGVLQRHRGPQVRRGVESSHVASRMYDRYKWVLSCEVGLVSVTAKESALLRFRSCSFLMHWGNLIPRRRGTN